MKRTLLLITCLSLLLVSCKQNTTENTNNNNLTGDQNIGINTNPEIDWVWGLDNNAEKLEKKEKITNKNNDPKSLLEKFNEIHSMNFKSKDEEGNDTELKLETEYQRQDKTMVYLLVKNSKILSQSMGSAGAQGYIASLTYTMTELEGIDRIYLKLSDGNGDHAETGYYTRESFNFEVIE